MKAAPVIVVANEKGGVGKTPIAANIAAALAKTGLRVVAVDGDSQSNLTHTVGTIGATPDDGSQPEGLAEAIEDAAGAAESPAPAAPPTLLPTAVENLWTLIGGRPLAEIAGGLGAAGADGEQWVADALAHVARQDSVDVVVVDTPPAPGPITIGALLAADVVLAVANTAKFYSAEAVDQIRQRLAGLEGRGGHAALHVVLTGFRKGRRLDNEMREALEDEPDGLIAVIPHSKDVEEAPMYGIPLVASRTRGSSRTAWALNDLAVAALHAAGPADTEGAAA